MASRPTSRARPSGASDKDAEPSAAPGRKGAAPDVPWKVRDKPTKKLLDFAPLEAALLKYLAGTTYGETETSIIHRAVRREMAAMFRERGWKVIEREDGSLDVRPPGGKG